MWWTQCWTVLVGWAGVVRSRMPHINSRKGQMRFCERMVLWGYLYFTLPVIDIMLTYPNACFARQV